MALFLGVVDSPVACSNNVLAGHSDLQVGMAPYETVLQVTT